MQVLHRLLYGIVGSYTKFVKLFKLIVRAQSNTKHIYQNLLICFLDGESLVFNSKAHESGVAHVVSFVTSHIYCYFFQSKFHLEVYFLNGFVDFLYG